MGQKDNTSNDAKSKSRTKMIKKLLLNSRDAAELSGVVPRTWRTWDRLGLNPQPVKIGRTLFWRAEELVQWIGEGCPKRDNWVYRPPKNLENPAIYTN